MTESPEVEAALLYQSAAQALDDATTAVLEEGLKFEGLDKGAIIAGAMMAIVRFTIRHMIHRGPQKITVRAVLEFVLPALNKAAEAQLSGQGKKTN